MLCREEHGALKRLVQDLRAKVDEAEGRCRRAEKDGGDAARLREKLVSLQGQHDQLRREVDFYQSDVVL